tara:strand:- start:315 stop:467 length:153 start_codon:yes stop_codon:yes gene_type:complete
MELFNKNTKAIIKVSLVIILLSFLGLKSKAAVESENDCQQNEIELNDEQK